MSDKFGKKIYEDKPNAPPPRRQGIIPVTS